MNENVVNKEFKVFILEDDEWYNKLLVHSISINPDYEVKCFFTAADFFKHINEKPDVATIDYRLPDAKGDEVLDKVKDLSPDTEVIIISEQENIETAIGLLKKGAYDYLVKDKNIRDRLLAVINNIRNKTNLKSRINVLEEELLKKHDFANTIIGTSEVMRNVFSLIEKASGINIVVTVTGETGTGKEVVAKAIHYNSDRKKKPFVAINVAAVPSELIESELFGHEKGAFTGAVTRRIGKFEEANGGTLFLDEIGDMELSFQAKMLRAIQEREIVRIGANTPVKIDCRIIVSTNKNLKEEVRSGHFREDLYFRLYGLNIELPPLRERGKDILILAKHFIDSSCKENKFPIKSLSDSAQSKLLAYNFPGNIRELKSTVELAVVMGIGDLIQPENINLSSNNTLTEVVSEEMTLHEYDLKIIKSYLKKYDNNMRFVAEKLDIGLSTIYRLLKAEEKE